jgi:tRNA(Arg) A34 adenosine deaminase TadA
MANITAQMGQGDKDFSGIGDYITVMPITQCAGNVYQSRRVITISQSQRLVFFQSFTS